MCQVNSTRPDIPAAGTADTVVDAIVGGAVDTVVALKTEPNVTIEMGGENVVIRSSGKIDQASTAALVTAVNAADDTDTVVVIDPDPIRCDDVFASSQHATVTVECVEHPSCRPVPVGTAATGILRILTETGAWLVDVARGRLSRGDVHADPRFLGPTAWSPVIAVCVTTSRLIALTADGTQLSATRAHGPLAAPV
jgi:hypothetical protein